MIYSLRKFAYAKEFQTGMKSGALCALDSFPHTVQAV